MARSGSSPCAAQRSGRAVLTGRSNRRIHPATLMRAAGSDLPVLRRMTRTGGRRSRARGRKLANAIVGRCIRWTEMPRGGHFAALEEPGDARRGHSGVFPPAARTAAAAVGKPTQRDAPGVYPKLRGAPCLKRRDSVITAACPRRRCENAAAPGLSAPLSGAVRFAAVVRLCRTMRVSYPSLRYSPSPLIGAPQAATQD